MSDEDAAFYKEKLFEILEDWKEKSNKQITKVNEFNSMSILERLKLKPADIINEKEKEEVTLQEAEYKQKHKEKYIKLLRKKKPSKKSE